MTELIIRVPGTPVGQPRVKAFRKGMHAGVYTPGTADHWKADICTHAQRTAQAAGWVRPDKKIPVCIDVDFHFERPASVSRKLFWKTTTPDIDNAVKATFDALKNSGLIATDAQVVDGRPRKFYDDDWHGAVIRITLAESPDLPIGHRSKPMPTAQEQLAFTPSPAQRDVVSPGNSDRSATFASQLIR
jgi:Holliday junction resolvase RusA-like endonuclease